MAQRIVIRHIQGRYASHPKWDEHYNMKIIKERNEVTINFYYIFQISSRL